MKQVQAKKKSVLLEILFDVMGDDKKTTAALRKDRLRESLAKSSK